MLRINSTAEEVSVAELVERANTAPLAQPRPSTRQETRPLAVPEPVDRPAAVEDPVAARNKRTMMKLSFAGLTSMVALTLLGLSLIEKGPASAEAPRAATPAAPSSAPPSSPLASTTPSPAPTTQTPAQMVAPRHTRAPRTSHLTETRAHRSPSTKGAPADPGAGIRQLLRNIENYHYTPPRLPGWPTTH